MKRIYIIIISLVLVLACSQGNYFDDYPESLIERYDYDPSFVQQECLFFNLDDSSWIIIENDVFRKYPWQFLYREYGSYKELLTTALNHSNHLNWDHPYYKETNSLLRFRIPRYLLDEADTDFESFKQKYLVQDTVIYYYPSTYFSKINPRYKSLTKQISALCFRHGLIVFTDKKDIWWVSDSLFLIPPAPMNGIQIPPQIR